MRILFTGASSFTGKQVLRQILDSFDDVEVWCTRHQSAVTASDSRVSVIDLNFAETFNSHLLPDAIDLVIHVAGVTHAHDPELYWDVNLRGTMRVAEAARARGCARFVYISTRCATMGAGAYGESKLAAENELRKLSWESLLIIRPSEIYGGQGSEGLDKLIALAQRWHLTPLLFGKKSISFAPLWLDDFAVIVADEIIKQTGGVRMLELCGPEDLSATAVAQRIAKRYHALAFPIWWPMFALLVKIAVRFNVSFAVPDQLQRLECAKTGSAATAHRTGRARFLIE